jgi:hypothetical protein
MMKKFCFLFLLIALPLFAQELKEETNSLFDEAEVKEFTMQSIMVDGEVEQPGMVDFAALPLRQVPVKEVVSQNGKDKFIGTYFYSGYSLFDIITAKKAKKANAAEFRPAVDLYVIVENARGEKAVFSWGEIFYGKDNFQFLISKSVNAINPSKMKMKWPLPSEPRLICSRDIYNVRFISNPTKITVKSFVGTFATTKPADIFSSKIEVSSGSQSATIADIKSTIEKRTYKNVGYGHGMGYKGIKDINGYLLKDILRETINIKNEEIGNSILCISAKDGYRVVYSLSEIINRSDNEDFLLSDNKDSKENGRFSTYSTPDFFVDRNVRSVEKIQIMQVK